MAAASGRRPPPAMGRGESLIQSPSARSAGGQVAAQLRYQRLADRYRPRPPVLRNAAVAFLTGGLVCLAGQALTDFFAWLMDMTQEEAGAPAVATMIFIGSLLTGLGVFDDLARFAGAGLAVPVTGFANSVASAALEFKREGLVLGVGSRMFSLAGSVIMFGVVTAFVVGVVAALLPDSFSSLPPLPR